MSKSKPVTKATEHLLKLDDELFSLGQKISILRSIAYSPHSQEEFLKDYAQGNPKIPLFDYPKLDFTEVKERLKLISNQAKSVSPIGELIAKTADNYRDACIMLENIGKPEFTEWSIKLYGKPGDRVVNTNFTNLEAAQHFVSIANEVSKSMELKTGDYCLPAEFLQKELSRRIVEFFTTDAVTVEIDPNLASKAVASAKRIRLRAGTSFSSFDVEQLWQHEALVHSLTAINGMNQPYFKVLGLGAPRTTQLQEGLATFAELVTGVIDLGRLKRIALRILAIDMALKGAEFVDVFRFFLESGQNEIESYQSTVRVFRGSGGVKDVVFTKDTVYLHGLISTHIYLKIELFHNRLDACKHLFTGRLAIEDLGCLQEYFDNGLLNKPKYLPPWLNNFSLLAGYLAYSLFLNKLEVDLMGNRPGNE